MTGRKLFHRGRRPGLVTRTSTVNTSMPSPLYGHLPQAPRRPYRVGVLDPKTPIFSIRGVRRVIVWPEELAANPPRFPNAAVEPTPVSEAGKVFARMRRDQSGWQGGGFFTPLTDTYRF